MYFIDKLTWRLFQKIMKDVDAILYVDTDILFMRPVEDVWSFFKRFNSTQIAAVSPEHEAPNAGWYNRFARHPYYGKLGESKPSAAFTLYLVGYFWFLFIYY